MGLTNTSTGTGVFEAELKIEKITPNDKIVALGGNPNVAGGVFESRSKRCEEPGVGEDIGL